MNQSTNKRFIPITLIRYIIEEFLKSFLIIFLVFLSITLLINFVEELIFFKEKDLDHFLFMVCYLTLYKTPNTLIELSIFIILFSGILFFSKFLKNNEINTIKLSGLSNMIPILTPAIVAFFLGLVIICIISPLSANALKLFEKNKRVYSKNENLIVINETGLWFMEKNKENYNIVRADKIGDDNFLKMQNATIYQLDKEFNFIQRLDIKEILVKEKIWILNDSYILDHKNDEKKIINKKPTEKIFFSSTININELKNFFSNVNTVSFWEILGSIKKLNERGYSALELKIKMHKYLSLPIYLFLMIILSTFFTLNIKKDYNNFMYIFFGIVLGILIFFLNDLSVAIGISGKIPLVASVWTPILLITFFCSINIAKLNEK